MATYLTTNAPADDLAFQWEVIEEMQQRWKTAIRPLMLAADLSATRTDAPLLEAVRFITGTLEAGRSLGKRDPEPCPRRWIPVCQKRYLYTQEPDDRKRLIPDRYEFLAYQRVRNGLEASDAQWQANTELLAASGRTTCTRASAPPSRTHPPYSRRSQSHAPPDRASSDG